MFCRPSGDVISLSPPTSCLYSLFFFIDQSTHQFLTSYSRSTYLLFCWKMAVAWCPMSEKTKVRRRADPTLCSVLVDRQMCKNAFDCIWGLMSWLHQNNLVGMGNSWLWCVECNGWTNSAVHWATWVASELSTRMFVNARYSVVRAMCSNGRTRGENVEDKWHGEVAVARAWRGHWDSTADHGASGITVISGPLQQGRKFRPSTPTKLKERC